MPSTSKKQHNFMAAVASNPKFAKKAGVPQAVGADFMKADTGRKFKKGGEMDKAYMEKEKTHVAAMKKAGVPKKIVKEEMAEAGMKKGGKVCMAKGGGIESKGKTQGKVVKMAKGGSVSSRADGCCQKGKTKGKWM